MVKIFHIERILIPLLKISYKNKSFAKRIAE